MSKLKITVFEHNTLRIGDVLSKDKVFEEKHLALLEAFYGTNGLPYYSLIHKGVKFNQYVGVLQLGNLTIEVLPKVDNNEEDEKTWRKLLIEMIWRVGTFTTHAPTSSNLSLKTNAILDVYIAMYLQELKRLVHQGLIKKYRTQEGNTLALKGSLVFSKHIQQNLVHQERFYTRHSVYDEQHLLHQVLYKALKLLKRINVNIALDSEINQLLFSFPEMEDIKVSESTFDKISINRKTASYETALGIAKLLLLNYHPDIRGGSSDVLALLFDMNALWERFVFVTLRKHLKNSHEVREQVKKDFWLSHTETNRSVKMFADIVITEKREESRVFVIDTKWKNLNGKPYPSVEDLRQMYVYHHFYKANKVALVYPSLESKEHKGKYLNSQNDDMCYLIHLGVKDDIANFEKQVVNVVKEWFTVSNSEIHIN
ncbi:restriction endonuclease [Myroides sp. BIT-d1]|uniref:Restriction endonuclease n=1 Tax=Myroides albus TaxID=2562892 RepID=A0A6I3LL14_9FLAO|nr:restriction endonuclease [Myroides albus]MTG98206.1 restriction endonuclease [Myroides albus]